MERRQIVDRQQRTCCGLRRYAYCMLQTTTCLPFRDISETQRCTSSTPISTPPVIHFCVLAKHMLLRNGASGRTQRLENDESMMVATPLPFLRSMVMSRSELQSYGSCYVHASRTRMSQYVAHVRSRPAVSYRDDD